MCGIGGVYIFNAKGCSPRPIREMMSVVDYRGPDDEGYLGLNTYSDKVKSFYSHDTIEVLKSKLNPLGTSEDHFNLWMGFRRLAIIDLSEAGHQPMVSRDGRYWLTFNGEIYNYIEIRNELKAFGHIFISGSDSEVILAAWSQWGVDSIQKFVGMFAIALWDTRAKQLILARDRFGVKPLLYFKDEDKIIWSSEEKQILASGFVNAGINKDAIYEYLLEHNEYTSTSSFYKDIHYLPPAHYITITSEGKVSKPYCYWDLKAVSVASNFEDRKEEFKKLFTDAVSLRMRSDVPMGIALSGGLDSSSIAMVASSLTQNPINTFSVYYTQDKQYDERPFIQEVLNAGSFIPTFYTQDDQISMDLLKKWVWLQDGPTLGASPLSAYLNYKNVRKAGITVLLNGQGGDEILGGYPYYYKYLIAHQSRTGQWKNLWGNVTGIFAKNDLKSSVAYIMQSMITRLVSKRRLYALEKRKYSTAEFYSDLTIDNYKHPESMIKFGDNPFKQSLYETLTQSMIPHMLHWEDRNSMGNSIESRVPFLDHRLVEYAFSLPDSDKIDKGWTKSILRESLKGILPEKIRLRTDKTGFLTPTSALLTGTLKKDVDDLLHSKKFKERGIWNSARILKHWNSKTTSMDEIWKIASLELWFDSLNTRQAHA